jgi:hypothetical protein
MGWLAFVLTLTVGVLGGILLMSFLFIARGASENDYTPSKACKLPDKLHFKFEKIEHT